MEPEQFSSIPQQESKVPSPKRGKKIFTVILILAALFGSFQYGLSLGKKGFAFESTEFKVVNQKDKVFDVDYNLLWDAIKVVQDKFIDNPVDQQKILYGAIRGAIAAAGDEYTQYFDPAELKEFRTELSGSFDGIGAEIGKKESNIVIISPLDGSPAEKAGLRPKDIIVSVNGETVADLSVEQTVKKIRGPKGTEVTLTIYREGDTKTFDVKIKREKIEVKSVKVEYKEQNGKKVALITLSRFGDDTKALFDRAVNEVVASGATGLVLDLRNNPGGYLETSVEVASQWLDKDKLVVTEAHSSGESIPYTSFGYKRLAGVKTVILINAGSASASEILAGALHDHKVASLIGEKSFGKGSVQELVELSDKSAVKVTVAKWVTPGGKNLNKDGLVPDIEVKLSDEDIEKDRDPQLQRALDEVIK